MSDGEGGEGGVPIHELPIEHLQSLRQQLEQEISQLTNHYGTLRGALARFHHGRSACTSVKEENYGKEMLVPMTQSMYVPGRLAASDKVLVDVGTGYFVEKDVAQAVDFFQRKIDYVQGNADKIEEIIMQKRKMAQQVVSVMQQKVQAQMQAQGKAASS